MKWMLIMQAGGDQGSGEGQCMQPETEAMKNVPENTTNGGDGEYFSDIRFLGWIFAPEVRISGIQPLCMSHSHSSPLFMSFN